MKITSDFFKNTAISMQTESIATSLKSGVLDPVLIFCESTQLLKVKIYSPSWMNYQENRDQPVRRYQVIVKRGRKNGGPLVERIGR